ncbi:MAG TPA: cellulose binding domain-containing protein, partial [Streptosporangiaceae bacterium]|nr:cellulose binding domain-containing protein [Streptosporangiaceae bacterium]
MRPATISLARRARYLVCLAVVGALAAAGVLSAHPQPAQAATGCQVAYSVNSDWGTGFSVAVTITNTGPAITSWTLGYSYAGNQQLSSGWSGTWTQSGQNIAVASASWNGALATGAATQIGANFSYTGTNKAPTAFTLNGTACNGGGTGPGTINVALTSPASGATYTAPATIPLAATASESGGTIAKVEFFSATNSGTTLLGTSTTSPYTFSWTGVAAGTYSL